MNAQGARETHAPTAQSEGSRMPWAIDPVYPFAWTVVAAGAATSAALALSGSLRDLASLPWHGLLFVALTIAAEMVQLKSPRQHDDSRVTPSNLFGLSALLLYGPGAGLLAFGGGVLIWGVVTRKPPLKIAFNTAQYAMSIGAAAVVLQHFTGIPHRGMPIHPSELPVICLAALAMFTVNEVCASTVTALAMGVPLRVRLRRDLPTILIIDGLLAGFAPVLVVAAHFSLATLPLVALPFAAIAYSVKQVERREHDASYDVLTGLANRSLFRARAGQELDRARYTGAGVGVLALDLDNFRDFNDTLGHAEADTLLEQVAERLRRAAGRDDLVARLGGDDFGLLALGTDGHSMLELAICVRAALDEPFVVAGLRLGVSASIGVAWAPEHGDDAEALLRYAEVAMYRAKVRRTGIETYDPAIDPHSAERLVLAAELRDGIARGELVLHYQPKLELASSEVVGVEALVRWRHPRRGLIPPSEFIELAERTDVIGALTMCVLRTALGQAAAWRRVGIDVPVAVNLPVQMLLDVNLPGDVASLLARFGLDGGTLMLEITEGSLIHDPHRSAQILDSLSAMGVRIAIDDYGSGYSSLAWLKRFPVDELKIDRSFVTELVRDESDAAIVRSTIELGRSLGITVVAEGVETTDVLEELAAYGCHTVQGFLISKPVPAAQFVTWLRGRRSEVRGHRA
jgi:diguanylate cyclase (GGDEF)-like protein